MKKDLSPFLEYAKFNNASDKVIKWLNTVFNNYYSKNEVTISEVEHVIDYLCQNTVVKMQMMSYPQAVKKAEKWTLQLQKQANKITEKKGDTKVVLDFKDGFKVVQLIGKNAFEREGKLMRNCVASYYGKDTKIYSLRDNFNNPHCTMEQDQQIKGKGNGDTHPKYIKYVVAFLEWTGMKVRDSEMKHLGYEVEMFPKYCKTPLFRDRYIRKGVKVEYIDKVIVFTDFYKANHYKGNKICLYKGDLKIQERNISLGKIQFVGGSLCIYSSASLKADNLRSVGGNLDIDSNSKINNFKTEYEIRKNIKIKGNILFI